MTMKTKNMKMKKATTLRALGAVAALAATGAAQAHTGHSTESLFAGLAHPLGLDHLLAMVAVGTWSAVALPAGRRGPARPPSWPRCWPARWQVPPAWRCR